MDASAVFRLAKLRVHSRLQYLEHIRCWHEADIRFHRCHVSFCVTIASGGLHEARIYEPAMEGQNLAPRLTSEIPTLTRHHQSLAFSLRA